MARLLDAVLFMAVTTLSFGSVLLYRAHFVWTHISCARLSRALLSLVCRSPRHPIRGALPCPAPPPPAPFSSPPPRPSPRPPPIRRTCSTSVLPRGARPS